MDPPLEGAASKLDHTLIYELVAATFSVLAVCVGDGPWVIYGLVGVWALVAFGLGRELTDGPVRRILLPLQFVAVAVALPALWLALVRMDTPTAILTVVGGACYLLGVFLSSMTGRDWHPASSHTTSSSMSW